MNVEQTIAHNSVNTCIPEINPRGKRIRYECAPLLQAERYPPTCMTRLATSPDPAGRTKRPTLPTIRASMHRGGQMCEDDALPELSRVGSQSAGR